MAQDENRADEALTDETTQLKKRARRRLIGAAALALFAAIVLPMVMDTQPAPPLRDIQVRIPSPDEGVTQNVAPPPRPAAQKPAAEEPPRPIAKPESAPAPKPALKTEEKATPAEKPAPPAARSDTESQRAQEALSGKSAATEAWEVQLGAYQSAGSVSNLIGKLKQLGVPTYTEKVETANGPRTRVRAGPFPTREAAEKAQVRIKKIIGVDGPVAQKP